MVRVMVNARARVRVGGEGTDCPEGKRAFQSHFPMTLNPRPHYKQPPSAPEPCREEPAANRVTEGPQSRQALSHPATLWASQVSGHSLVGLSLRVGTAKIGGAHV